MVLGFDGCRVKHTTHPQRTLDGHSDLFALFLERLSHIWIFVL